MSERARVKHLELVLFGDPVDHSWSPAIHQAALDAVGLDGTYRAIRVDFAGLRRGCADLRAGRWHGANITMPFKRVAAAETDERSSGAERSGSVNTIVVDGSRLVGHNTDIDGIRRVWEETDLPLDAPVLVLGSGGAAAGALIALERHDRFVSSRRLEAAERLAKTAGRGVRAVPWTTAMPGAVVINATPLGMQGEALPAGLVEASSGLLEMTYGRGATRAERTARQAGLPCASGTDLLLAQAIVSFTLWTGLAAPSEEMSRALQKAQATG